MRVGSFDDLVGAGEQGRRDFQSERFGNLEVDQELELCCLVDRQVGCVFALEDSGGVKSGAAIGVCNVVAITHQSTLRDPFAAEANVRDRFVRHQGDDLLTTNRKEWIGSDNKRVDAMLPERGESDVDLVGGTGIENKQLPAEVTRRLLGVRQRCSDSPSTR